MNRHSYTADEPTAPRGRDMEHQQPPGNNNRIKVKQPALSTSAK